MTNKHGPASAAMAGQKGDGMTHDKLLSNVYAKAKATGRLCTRCGWIVTVKAAKKGYALCVSCNDALKGVNVSFGHYKASDEPGNKSGEMP
jgi:hypothetical protein